MKHKFFYVVTAMLLSGASMGLYAQTDGVQPQIVEQEIAQLDSTLGTGVPPVKNPLLNGEWTIYDVYGEKVTGEERPYIDIVNDEGRFYGSNGCNILNGSVITAGDNGIVFTNVLSTKKYCHDAQFEYKINVTLDAVRSYTINQYGHEYYLDLKNSSGQVVMVLRRHNMDFLNGAWRVTSINGKHNANEGVEFVIDIPSGTIHGNTGCNILNGDLTIDPDKAHAIQFNHLATTRMMCPDYETEMALTVALEEVQTAYADGNDAAVMYNGRGKEVLRLQRINLADLRE